MIFISDKLIIFLALFYFYFSVNGLNTVIFPVLYCLILSGLNSYFEHAFMYTLSFVLYLLLCVHDVNYLFFVPLLIYDLAYTKTYKLLFLALILPYLYLHMLPYQLFIFLLAACIFSIYLKKKSACLATLTSTHYTFKNQSEEMENLLKQKNKALLEQQDSEIHIATLNERNRIAREIHDNVGHLLSRCLLQIGALMTLNHDPLLTPSLEQIKGTLSDAMTTIRSSVHDLHDEALDLNTELHKLTASFDFCRVYLNYDITSNLSQEIKYSFIAIVKEALSNVIKHSTATQVEITLREHPAFFQLIIADNGTLQQLNQNSGIGLNNMKSRIAELHGQFSIDPANGFKIFITVPKK